MSHFPTQLQSSGKYIDRWSTNDAFVPHNQTLLTLKVCGRTRTTKLKTTLPARPTFVGNFLEKTDQDIQRRFVLEVDPNLGLNREKFKLNTYRYYQLDKTCIVNTSAQA